MDKKSLRREYLKLRADIPPEERKAADSAIARRVEALPEFRNAAVVAGYVTDGTEPDVLSIIRSALKKVAVPVCQNGTETNISSLLWIRRISIPSLPANGGCSNRSSRVPWMDLFRLKTCCIWFPAWRSMTSSTVSDAAGEFMTES